MNRHLGMKPLRIVSIGGGTGLATLLRGLKRYSRAAQGAIEITAVVTVTDDGGSSGRLRRDFDVLPPGDIRNCMVALSQDEALLARLFNYRFDSGRGLKGHSFGNLFLTAMTHLTGDFAHAVRLSAEVLAVGGRIFPSTASNVRIEATLDNGQQVFGESKIGRSKRPIQEVRLVPRKAKPLKETLEAIAEADIITMGPGSLFTSVIPNVLVSGIPKAIASSPASKIYFVNLMTQPGETVGLTASDHVRMIAKHCKSPGRGPIDICVVNSGILGSGAVREYGKKSAQPVFTDIDELRDMGVRVITTDLVRKAGRTEPAKIRHDSGALGAITIELAQEHRFESERKSRKLKR
ncbi:MAG: gluconeogenesis factor YvcK family protein [Acidobacteriota bacterium]